MSDLRTRHIVVSYSTDGIIPLDAVLQAMSDRGRLSVFTRSYKRYRVSRQRPSTRPHTVEYVLAADTSRSGSASNSRFVREAIVCQSESKNEALDFAETWEGRFLG